MKRKNILLVTCRAGNEKWCEEEVGNILYPLDPELEIKPTKYKGVLLVLTRTSPTLAYKSLLSKEYGFVERVVPFQVITRPTPEEIADAVEALVKGFKGSLRLQIVFRGIRGLSSIVWSLLRRKLESIGVYIDKRARKCLYVESVDDLVGIAFVDCWSVKGVE